MTLEPHGAANEDETGGAEENEILAEVLADLPEDSPLRGQLVGLFSMHSGPLPSPDTLRAYKEIDPRVLDEVVHGARANRGHRYAMDRRLTGTARLSLILTVVVILAVLATTLGLAALGYPVLSGIFGVGGLGTVAAVLIRGGGRWDGRGSGTQALPTRAEDQGQGAP